MQSDSKGEELATPNPRSLEITNGPPPLIVLPIPIGPQCHENPVRDGLTGTETPSPGLGGRHGNKGGQVHGAACLIENDPAQC